MEEKWSMCQWQQSYFISPTWIMWIFMDIFKMRVLRWNVKTYSAYSFKMGTEYTKNDKNRFRNANLQRNFWLNWAQYKGSIGEKLVTLFIERLKIETWKLLHSIRNWKSCWIEYLNIKIGSKLPKTHTHFCTSITFAHRTIWRATHTSKLTKS